MSLHVFTGLHVRELGAARPWYADDAGSSVPTIFVDSLDAHMDTIAGRGLEPAERLTYSNTVRKSIRLDPDRNELDSCDAPLNAG